MYALGFRVSDAHIFHLSACSCLLSLSSIAQNRRHVETHVVTIGLCKTSDCIVYSVVTYIGGSVSLGSLTVIACFTCCIALITSLGLESGTIRLITTCCKQRARPWGRWIITPRRRGLSFCLPSSWPAAFIEYPTQDFLHYGIWWAESMMHVVKAESNLYKIEARRPA